MKTTTRLTLASLIESTNIPASLVRAVVRQLGGWESFQESAPDICRGGIDGGFHGFIYYTDTHTFAKRNRAAIAEMAKEQAEDFGSNVFTMIEGFGCFRNGSKPERSGISTALYGGKEQEDTGTVLNALAWYAGEEVARAYVNMTEN